jgi:hypothetical protein
MKITQISIFLENKRGRLYDVCSLFGKNNVNIRALTIAETEGFGVLRVVVDKPQEAVKLLKQNGFVAGLTDIVVVEVDDRPGGLADILKVFTDNDINVEYMYGFVEKFTDKALMVFRLENPDRAADLLTKNNIKIVRKDDIANL